MLLAECARRGMDVSFVDIRSAYLKADLKIKQYMTPPMGVTRLIGHSSSGPYGEITAKKHALGFQCCCMWLSKSGTPVYCTRKCDHYFVYWPTVV